MNHRQLGRFRVGRVADLSEDMLQALRLIHDKVIVFRCEMLYAEGALEYVALCEEFDVVPLGDELPRYNVLVHLPIEGQMSIQFIKEVV